MRLLITFLILASFAFGQQSVLVIGNHDALCLEDSIKFERTDSLPSSLHSFDAIMLFSGSTSHLSEKDVDRIVYFVESGGGLYSGAENWPLQAESNQLTHRIYKKESFGSFDVSKAEVNKENGNLELQSMEILPAGTTTVAFPMDHRLKVEAWIEDQPLILSGEIAEGRIIIDGGYSRFYCNARNDKTDTLLREFLKFLLHQ